MKLTLPSANINLYSYLLLFLLSNLHKLIQICKMFYLWMFAPRLFCLCWAYTGFFWISATPSCRNIIFIGNLVLPIHGCVYSHYLKITALVLDAFCLAWIWSLGCLSWFWWQYTLCCLFWLSAPISASHFHLFWLHDRRSSFLSYIYHNVHRMTQYGLWYMLLLVIFHQWLKFSITGKPSLICPL